MNTRSAVLSLRIAVARLHQDVGIPGLLGLVLLAGAAVNGSLAWREHQRLHAEPYAISLQPPSAAQPAMATEPAPATLPPSSDIPLLLTRIQRAALDAGLGWPRADYRLKPATEDVPASLEAHCAPRGQYLRRRRLCTAMP